MKKLSKASLRRGMCTVIALLIAGMALFPLYWLFICSLKTDVEIFSNKASLFVIKPVWENYTSQLGSLMRAFPNSLCQALGNVLLTSVLAIPAAYGIARYDMKGKNTIIQAFITTQMLPASLLLTTMYLMFSRASLLNTRVAPVLAIATISIPFTIVVLRPVFKQFPVEIDEAARIDGCTTLGVFLKIFIPVCRPGIITCLCFSFVHGWNNLIYNITFSTKAEYRSMTSGIYRLINEQGTMWNQIMAYGVILVLPIIILFIFAQKYIIDGMTAGSVKQ